MADRSYGSATQLYAWKYFTFIKDGPPDDGHCLIYDPKHDNSIGLPPTFTSYAATKGTCLLVDQGDVTTNHVVLHPSGQAPHTIGFTWWSKI
jgi:hypothetical protein